MKHLICTLNILLLVFGSLNLGSQGLPPKTYTWRIRASLQFSGTVVRAPGQAADTFSFELFQLLTMARDNGDYLVADADLPICQSEYRLAGSTKLSGQDFERVLLEPRIYYVSRDNGRCQVPLAIREREWPKDLPSLTLPLSREAKFLPESKGYSRHVISGTQVLSFAEEQLFNEEIWILPVDWQWQSEKAGCKETHRLCGELRFERIADNSGRGQVE